MKTIGIIPAGGSASRFGGLAKELLPVSPHDCALTRAVKSMQIGGATEIYIASRQDRTVEHWRAVESFIGVKLAAREFRTWWEFVRQIGKTTRADRYLFAMADTYYPLDAFAREFPHDVTAGVFHTDKPGRFGILAGSRIHDKHPGMTGYAWGVWAWSREAMDCIIADAAVDAEAGLNKLIERFGVDKFEMPYYHDFAAFEDYREFLCSRI